MGVTCAVLPYALSIDADYCANCCEHCSHCTFAGPAFFYCLCDVDGGPVEMYVHYCMNLEFVTRRITDYELYRGNLGSRGHTHYAAAVPPIHATLE